MLWRIACLFWCFSLSAAAETLPQILRHSDPLIRAAKGQQIALQVELVDQSKAIWYSHAKILCSGLICEFDTSNWPVGQHLITLLVFNDLGSHMVEFHLQLNSAVASKQRLSVPLVDAVVSPDSVGKDEDYVISRTNSGFSYRSDTPHRAQAKLQIVRNFPRKLDWNENLRSSQGHLKFGRLHADEHYLWPGGQLQLLRVDGENRIIVLQQGALRSRSLHEQKIAPFTVIAGNWLQLDGLSQADFVVELEKESSTKATVHVLRGEVQVRWRDPLLTPDVFGELSEEELQIEEKMRREAAEQVYLISSGQRFEISTDVGLKYRYEPLQGERVQTFLQETTPHFLGEAEPAGANGVLPFLEAARLLKPPAQIAEAKALASNDLDRHDYLLVLERLQALTQSENDPDWHTLLARAYSGLSLSAPAIKHLRQGHDLRPNDPEISFLMGRIFLEQGRWEQSDRRLRKALASGLEGNTLAQYYSGVAAFQGRDWNRSRRHFLQLVHDNAQADLIESSQEFLSVLEEKQDFMADIWIALRHDSHIFGIDSASRLNTYDAGLSSSGAGYQLGLRAKKRFAIDRPVDWALFGHISRRDWFSSGLSEAGRVDQGLGAEMRTGAAKRWRLAADLESIVIGSKRALDGVGLNLSYRLSEGFARPVLGVGYRRYLDPMPAAADLIDPLSEEWQAVASDRSSSLSEISLRLAEKMGYRWQLTSELKFWQRILASELAKTLNERRWQVEAGLKWRWLSQVHLLAGLQLLKRDFPEGSRQEQRLGLSTALEWQFTDRWQLTASGLYQLQDSNQNDYSWTRSVIQSGLIYQF